MVVTGNALGYLVRETAHAAASWHRMSHENIPLVNNINDLQR